MVKMPWSLVRPVLHSLNCTLLFAYKGPGLVGKIRDELAEELRKEGKTWEQIIGSDDK